jgi:GNAT superfamily N-acetyltransferase
MVDVRVIWVPPSDTWELRRAVLRPARAVTDMALPDDGDPLTATFAALDDDGVVVGCARVGIDGPPPSLVGVWTGGASSWRLRGMATRQGLRNAGIGSQVLGRALEYVADQGGGLLWCNARVPAIGLYRRAGLVEHGGIWDEPPIGPHIVMWKSVPAGQVDVDQRHGPTEASRYGG